METTERLVERVRAFLIGGILVMGSVVLLNGCNETESKTVEASGGGTSSKSETRSSPSVPAGTTLNVALGTTISSKEANSGDAWHGTVTDNVTTASGVIIPAGSKVSGVVTGVVPAKRGDLAMLDLAVRSVEVEGKTTSLDANTQPVVAGSPRARNLGAIAGGAAAGALIGKNVGDGKNAAVGGLIGGVTAAGVVAASKGYQVILKSGTVMNFTVNETVSMR